MATKSLQAPVPAIRGIVEPRPDVVQDCGNRLAVDYGVVDQVITNRALARPQLAA